MQLNRLALQASQSLFDSTELLRVERHRIGGACVLDCGIHVPGSVEAGRLLSLVALADLGRVELVPGSANIAAGPSVQVTTDQPVAGCMASQYAGWEIREGDFLRWAQARCELPPIAKKFLKTLDTLKKRTAR